MLTVCNTFRLGIFYVNVSRILPGNNNFILLDLEEYLRWGRKRDGTEMKRVGGGEGGREGEREGGFPFLPVMF